MADKRVFFFVVMFVLHLSPVFAQLATALPQGQEFFIDLEGEEPRFIQRLSWEEAMYAFRYAVIVEQLREDGSYHELLRDSTSESFFDLPLYAGQYRFRVDVYDLMNEFAFSTEWRYFEVLRAFQPRLAGFSPQVFLLDSTETWELSLHGENLLPESRFYLVRGNARIMPQRHISEGDSATLVFNRASLTSGRYYIHVINPGGLDTRLGTFTIRRSFDLNISLGFAPIVPLYGFLFEDFSYRDYTVPAPFPDNFYALSAIARINFIPFKMAWGYIGAELSSSLSALEHQREHHTANAFFLNTHLSLLYQRYFFRRNLAFNLTAGFGITTLFDFHYTYPVAPQTERLTHHYISAIAGISVKGVFLNPFFISAGVDFIHVFSPEGSMPGFIRPSIAAGVRF